MFPLPGLTERAQGPPHALTVDANSSVLGTTDVLTDLEIVREGCISSLEEGIMTVHSHRGDDS